MTAFAHLSGGFGFLPAPGVVCPCASGRKRLAAALCHSLGAAALDSHCAYIMRAKAARRVDLHWASGRRIP
jgi:hypothetical protein